MSLQTEIDRLNELADGKDITQHALKILINSLYGAMGNKHFIMANPDLAAAITSSGRFFIRLLADNIENELQKLHPYNKPYIVAGDTDSVLGSSMLNLKNCKGAQIRTKIEDLWDSTEGEIITTESGAEIKRVKNLKSLTYDSKLTYNNVNYIMRHRVQKKLFKIISKGKSVTVTEDHSLMVLRNDILMEVKPKDIIKGDKIILCYW